MARDRADAAVVNALTPVCVAKFEAQADATAKLTEFKKISSSWDKRSFIEKGGWATTPGGDKPNSDVATACAEKLGKSDMTPEELRLECLKLVLQSANATGVPMETSQLMSRARAYADFVMNWSGHGGGDSASGSSVPKKNLGEGMRDTPSVTNLDAAPINGQPRGAG